MIKNYYDILELKKEASYDDIKKAYHRLSFLYHPDKNDNHNDRFIEIKEAYDILSDKKKREKYDNEIVIKEITNIHYDPSIDILITVDDTFDGEIEYERFVKCKFLNDKGTNPYPECNIEEIVDCDYCNMTGMADNNRSCWHCNGKGFTVFNYCDRCDKKKEYIGKQKIQNIKLSDERITVIKNMGNYDKNSDRIGNLLLKKSYI